MRLRTTLLTVAAAAIYQRIRRSGFATRFHSRANALHLPGKLRSGKWRLTKDHYVLSMTATAGTESARHSMELVGK